MYSLLLLNGGVGTRIVATQPSSSSGQRIPIFVYALVVAWRNRRDTEIVINYRRVDESEI